MDTSRVSLGETVAAAGGLALLVSMFLPWFGGELSGLGAPVRVSATETGWESFGGPFKLVILACAIVAVGTAVARAMDARPQLPVEQSLLVLAAGAAALLVVVVRLVDPPDVTAVAVPGLEVDVSRKVAAFVAAGAAAAIAYGGLLQRREWVVARRS